jgi:hypothetical protein
MIPMGEGPGGERGSGKTSKLLAALRRGDKLQKGRHLREGETPGSSSVDTLKCGQHRPFLALELASTREEEAGSRLYDEETESPRGENAKRATTAGGA